MRTLQLLFRYFLFFVYPMLAHAADSSPQLSLADAINTARRENRDLTAAKFIIEQAQGRLMQAGLWPNPELEIARSSDRVFGDKGEYSGSAGFKQRFPISGRLADAENVARVDVASSIAEVRNQQRLLIGDVAGRYRELLVIHEKLRVNQQLEKTLQHLIDVTQKRLKVAEVSPADLNLEKLELQKLILSRSTLTIEKEVAEVALNQLLGREPTTALYLSEKIDSKLNLDVLRKASAEAVSRRPDRQQLALQIDRAQAEVQLAKAERWEDWTVGFGYERDRTVFDSSTIPTDSSDLVGVSVSIPLPLWNRNEGKIAEASASRGQAHAQLLALELKIQSEVQTAENQVRRLIDVLKQYDKESLPLAEQNVALLQKSYTDGLIAITAVIQAQQQQREIRQSYTEAVGDFLKSLTEFETTTASSPFFGEEKL